MEHVHPRSSIGSVSGVDVFLDGHEADEGQDEKRHAEYDESERAGVPQHPAAQRAAAPPRERKRERPGGEKSERGGAPHPREARRRTRRFIDAF